jgi:phosphoribosylamine---glycine ligase
MKILVIGSGGREHALCEAFKRSAQTTQIFCANGNGGISEIASCIDIKPDEINKLADFAASEKIDLTFVGGETSLALGVVDEFEKRNLKIVGVSAKAAQLEASKAFAKDFMQRHTVPTAAYETANSPQEAIEILESGKFGDENAPVVIKADGLAAGKGVVVAQNRNEAIEAIGDLSSGELISREAAAKIVLEECLFGREVSLLVFADGKNFALMPPARDHKRIGEGA